MTQTSKNQEDFLSTIISFRLSQAQAAELRAKSRRLGKQHCVLIREFVESGLKEVA